MTGPMGLINRAGLLTPVSRLKLPLGSRIPLSPRGHGPYNFPEPVDKGSAGVSSEVVDRKINATQRSQKKIDFLFIYVFLTLAKFSLLFIIKIAFFLQYPFPRYFMKPNLAHCMEQNMTFSSHSSLTHEGLVIFGRSYIRTIYDKNGKMFPLHPSLQLQISD